LDHIEERTISGLRVLIDRTLCVAFETCIDIAPDVFRLGDDGVVTFVEPTPEIERARLTEACKSCPVDALTLFDADGGQV
jgi:ferredoxin